MSQCRPDVRVATATQFELVSLHKPSNFVLGEVVAGRLSFVIENLPKTTPQTGCPGRWMFDQMMAHFGSAVTSIEGNWFGPNSDNLMELNRLTAGGTMSIEDAAIKTWTGRRAKDHGFTKVVVTGTPVGLPGRFTSVQVVFHK